MKKYIIALSAFTLMAFAVNAQSADSTNNSATQHNNWHMHQHTQGYGMNRHREHSMMMNLNLTDAQKQQVTALNKDYRDKVQNLEKDDNITLKDYRAQKANFENERKSKFQDILTPVQKNKLALYKKERGEKMKEMAQKRMDKMKTDLSLTDDQVAKIQDVKKSMMEQAKAIKENSSLTEQQKKEQFMNLRKTSHDNINKILTADQLRKKEQMRSDRMKDMKNKWENKAS
jgi:Spy/CpxP family protein refolding chaperone